MIDWEEVDLPMAVYDLEPRHKAKITLEWFHKETSKVLDPKRTLKMCEELCRGTHLGRRRTLKLMCSVGQNAER